MKIVRRLCRDTLNARGRGHGGTSGIRGSDGRFRSRHPLRPGRDFFADANIELAVRTIYGGPELADALDLGELDMGELGSPPAVTAIAAGKRFQDRGQRL